MVHMLERAREVHKINDGQTGRNSLIKCPFCIADEDEQWFRQVRFGYKPPDERPEKMPAPHCSRCPLLSLFNVDVQKLMDDCVLMGKFALEVWEDLGNDRY
jgi:hypothetical protein